MSSTDSYTVYLPDGSVRTFPKTFSAEEVRQALISSGVGSSLASATLTVESGGNTIRFSRPVGGTKGL